MEIFELAAELGKTLKADARLVALEEKRIAYEEDEDVKRLLTEYEVQQKAIETEAVKSDRDDALLVTIQRRIDELYDQITHTSAYLALEAAQNEVNELMNAVNNTITFQINGTETSGCTHDCRTCGGCH